MKATSSFSQIVLIAFVATMCTYAQTSLLRDEEGWTVFKPHTDTKIIYVSSSTGNDDSGKVYNPTASEIGKDPFNPTDKIKPFKTINAAYKASRNSKPDWILLKRNDIWYESLQARNGLSDDAPFLVASYGDGKNRPLLKTGEKHGIQYCCKNFNNVAFVDLEFYAHTRNPETEEYTGPDGSSGFSFYVGEDFTGQGLLIEGCLFRFYSSNVIQGPGVLKNMVVRRCVILDNYCATAHSQGLYTHNVSITLEENVFDHNGWYKQQIDGGNDQAEGQATMFNHNTYFANSHDVIFRKNLFLRPSSIGNKWTANSGVASSQNIIIDNNLYVDGEIGISMGGNESVPPHRFKNIEVTNNVMLDMGRSRPTNRTLGWYMEINDWDIGTVSGNCFLHKSNPDVGNVYGINLIGQTRSVSIDSNIFYGINTGSQLIGIDTGADKSDISITNNIFHNQNTRGVIFKITGGLKNIVFNGNNYFSVRNQNEWFQIDKKTYSLEQWKDISNDENSFTLKDEFIDPNRTIETYMKHLNKIESLDAFISEVRKQSKSNWRSEYTSEHINDWIRAGFKKQNATQMKMIDKYGLEKKSSQMVISHNMYKLNGQYIGTINYNKHDFRKEPNSIVLIQSVTPNGRCGKSMKKVILP